MIPLFKTYWDETAVKGLEEVIKRGSYWATGPEIQEFETELADFTEREYALTFNSGTSALHAMYHAVGVKDHEVIVPSFTFVATANAVILAGGTPVFAESEGDTYGLDAADVEARITDKTKAIVALNYAGGVSRDIERLRQIADERGIVLLEDNAHSLGVKKGEKQCGTFGTAAALSFCQNKLITTGEGGAVITDSEELYEKMKLFRSHGRVDSGNDYFSSSEEFEYLEPGHNYRMPTLCAALGLSQLRNFEKIMSMRVDAGEYLGKKLEELDVDIRVPKTFNDSDHFYQMYTIELLNVSIRDAIKDHLSNNGVMCRVYYYPIHLMSFYKAEYGCVVGDLPHTEALSKRVLTLPMWPGVSLAELDKISDTIKYYFGGKK
jgi:perosamine synthetase